MAAPIGLVAGGLVRRLWATDTGKAVVIVVALVVVSNIFGPAMLITMITPIVATVINNSQTCTPDGGAGGGSDPGLAAEALTVPGGVTAPEALTKDQVGVAWTIWQTARAVAGDLGIGNDPQRIEQAALIGMITAAQESTWGANKTAVSQPNGDGDMGVFQQRVLLGWYYNGTTQRANEAQARDVARQARIFFLGNKVSREAHAAATRAGVEPAGPAGYVVPGLKQTDSWDEMTPTEAAQAVQRSAFPDAYGKHEPVAAALITAFKNAPGADQPPPAATGDGTPDAAVGAGCPAGAAVTAMKCPELPPAQAAMLRGTQPDVQLVARCVKQSFGRIQQMYGVGQRPNVSDHPDGKAVDLMLSDGAFPNYNSPAARAYGDEIAAFLTKNAKQLGVTYVVWNERIWNLEREREGWRTCQTTAAPTCYAGPDDNAAHRNQLHVSTQGDGAIKEIDPTVMTNGGRLNPNGARAPMDSWVFGARWRDTGAWSKWHTGVDLKGNPNGTPVYAVADGTVIAGTSGTAGWAGTQYVAIQHGDAGATLYAHLDVKTVQPGATVKAGDQIGVTGERGRTFGPHLHFEYYPPGVTPGRVYETGDPDTWMQSLGVSLQSGKT